MKPEISEEIISGWRSEFHSWWSLRSIGMAKDNNYPMMEIAYIAAKTSSHESILELEREKSRLNSFCNEFVYGEENPNYYTTMQEKLTKRDELLKEAEWIIINADHGDYPEKWIKNYEQLEQEK